MLQVLNFVYRLMGGNSALEKFLAKGATRVVDLTHFSFKVTRISVVYE